MITKLYEQNELPLTTAIYLYIQNYKPLLSALDEKEIHKRLKLRNPTHEDDFDWKCLKNKIYTTPGFANIFHKPEIMLWACYETLSQILSQSNDGVTDSMCICPYNRRKFYIKAENDYVVLLIPNEY